MVTISSEPCRDTEPHQRLAKWEVLVNMKSSCFNVYYNIGNILDMYARSSHFASCSLECRNFQTQLLPIDLSLATSQIKFGWKYGQPLVQNTIKIFANKMLENYNLRQWSIIRNEQNNNRVVFVFYKHYLKLLIWINNYFNKLLKLSGNYGFPCQPVGLVYQQWKGLYTDLHNMFCIFTGYRKEVKVPGCHIEYVKMNACRGYCMTYSFLSDAATLERSGGTQLFTSHGSCCSITSTHDVSLHSVHASGTQFPEWKRFSLNQAAGFVTGRPLPYIVVQSPTAANWNFVWENSMQLAWPDISQFWVWITDRSIYANSTTTLYFLSTLPNNERFITSKIVHILGVNKIYWTVFILD